MSLAQIVQDASAAYAREEDSRHAAVMNALTQIRDILAMLAPEVQALHDAVAAQTVAITGATSLISTLESQAATLTSQVASVTAGAAIDADDLAEIVANTTAINATVTNLKAAMPVPVAPAVVAAAAAAAPLAGA